MKTIKGNKIIRFVFRQIYSDGPEVDRLKAEEIIGRGTN